MLKSIRDIYQKLREVKYHHLVKLYKRLLKKVPSNCKYNYAYTINPGTKSEVVIRLCLLHQPEMDLKAGIFPHLIDVCQEPEHCISCNAFVLRHSKESIKLGLDEELKNPKIKADKYPDICALEWALGISPDEVILPLGLFRRLWSALKNLKVWPII